jgi:hypothetical protein
MMMMISKMHQMVLVLARMKRRMKKRSLSIQPPLLITSLTNDVDFVTIAGFKPSRVETLLKQRTLQKKWLLLAGTLF